MYLQKAEEEFRLRMSLSLNSRLAAATELHLSTWQLETIGF